MKVFSVLILIFPNPSQPFIFPTEEEEDYAGIFFDPVKETRDYDTDSLGWFGLFQKEEDKSDEIEEIENWAERLGLIFKQKEENKNTETNVPVISSEWMTIYKEMMEELSKIEKVVKESKISEDLISKYNQSLHQLEELKVILEEEFESNIIERFHSTAQTLAEGKNFLLSYNWYEKYSNALANLEEIKTLIDTSLSKEIGAITNKLSGLKKSWEQFSVYNILQEQYKKLTDDSWFSSKNGSLLTSWKSALPKVSSYQDIITKYLPNMNTVKPVCTSKILTCPDYKQTFTADTCCSPLWHSVGSPLGLGNECWVDLDKMAAQCDIFSCYGDLVNGTFNSTDGCTYIPDVLLNYESCVIHDLCYVTPGVTKAGCDKALKENMIKIYCENVNRYERKLCSIRASLAARALEWTDKYFVAAGMARKTCRLSDSLITRIWKYSFNRVFKPIF